MSRHAHLLRWGLVVVALALLTVFPAIDLHVTAVFYDAGHGFPYRADAVGQFVRRFVPRIIVWSLVALVLVGIAGLLRRHTVLGLTWRRLVFLCTSIIVGPGLIVETLLKPHWHRPRPDMILPFGGSVAYARPLLIAQGCEGNCSFVSGHTATAFWLTAYALLLPPRYRRISFAAALAFGAFVGAVRVMQGAHFVSDVAYAGAIVVGVNLLLARSILEQPA